MKKLITLVFAFSFILYLSNVTSAQGRGGGQGRGPAVTGSSTGQSRAPEVNKGADHGKSADHDTTHAAKETKDSKDAHKDANFENRIEQNAALKAKVTGMLPAGTDLKTAASGFKNEGQFIAALHVSKNLNIPFADLKAKMTGTNPESLGAAIHTLKPNIPESDAKKEAEKAEKEAKATEKVKPIS